MFYLGIDVAKAKLDCCLLIDEQAQRKRNKSVTNNANGISQLLAWLAKQLPEQPPSQSPDTVPQHIHAIMESTGTYHQQAAALLHRAGVQVSICNPAQVRHFAQGIGVRSKDDSIDSHVLARYGQMINPQPWQPEPEAVQILCALLTRRQVMHQERQREQARQSKLPTATLHINAVHQSLRKSIDFLDSQIKALDTLIEQHIRQDPQLKQDKALLLSIPAVGPRVACQMLQLMHAKRFTIAEQLAAYVGIIPVKRQSGTSLNGRSRLSKASKLRATSYMAAMGACRHNPHIKAHYQRLLAAGKSKLSALGAAMRKLVHLCFGVLHTRQPYRADYVHGRQAGKQIAKRVDANTISTGAATVLLGAIAP
jgi:transposase